MSNNLAKRLLSEFLSFLQYKIDNDLLTMEEMDSLSKTVETNLNLIGTADVFSKFYDQPRTNISSVIHRKLLDKPQRRVFYSFNSFQRIVPNKWKCHSGHIGNQDDNTNE